MRMGSMRWSRHSVGALGRPVLLAIPILAATNAQAAQASEVQTSQRPGVSVRVVEERPGWRCPEMAAHLRSLEERVWLSWTRIRFRDQDDRTLWASWKEPVILSIELCPQSATPPGAAVSCRAPYARKVAFSSGSERLDFAALEAIDTSGDRPWPTGGGCDRNYLRVSVSFTPQSLDQADVLGVLKKTLKQPDPLVRGLAAAALGRMGEAAWPSLCELAQLTRDPDEAVRVAARGAVQRIIGVPLPRSAWP